MSAGPNAKPLGVEGWNCPVEELPQFTCGCGAAGRADELLAEDDNDILYCPQCETAGWEWQ